MSSEITTFKEIDELLVTQGNSMFMVTVKETQLIFTITYINKKYLCYSSYGFTTESTRKEELLENIKTELRNKGFKDSFLNDDFIEEESFDYDENEYIDFSFPHNFYSEELTNIEWRDVVKSVLQDKLNSKQEKYRVILDSFSLEDLSLLTDSYSSGKGLSSYLDWQKNQLKNIIYNLSERYGGRMRESRREDRNLRDLLNFRSYSYDPKDISRFLRECSYLMRKDEIDELELGISKDTFFNERETFLEKIKFNTDILNEINNFLKLGYSYEQSKGLREIKNKKTFDFITPNTSVSMIGILRKYEEKGYLKYIDDQIDYIKSLKGTDEQVKNLEDFYDIIRTKTNEKKQDELYLYNKLSYGKHKRKILVEAVDSKISSENFLKLLDCTNHNELSPLLKGETESFSYGVKKMLGQLKPIDLGIIDIKIKEKILLEKTKKEFQFLTNINHESQQIKKGSEDLVKETNETISILNKKKLEHEEKIKKYQDRVRYVNLDLLEKEKSKIEEIKNQLEQQDLSEKDKEDLVLELEKHLGTFELIKAGKST